MQSVLSSVPRLIGMVGSVLFFAASIRLAAALRTISSCISKVPVDGGGRAIRIALMVSGASSSFLNTEEKIVLVNVGLIIVYY